jgi:hypothetical protein
MVKIIDQKIQDSSVEAVVVINHLELLDFEQV